MENELWVVCVWFIKFIDFPFRMIEATHHWLWRWLLYAKIKKKMLWVRCIGRKTVATCTRIESSVWHVCMATGWLRKSSQQHHLLHHRTNNTIWFDLIFFFPNKNRFFSSYFLGGKKNSFLLGFDFLCVWFKRRSLFASVAQCTRN